MEVNELKSDKTVIDWLQRVRAADNTKETYLTSLHFYTEFTNKSPTELIEEAEDEIDSHVRARKQKMYEYISNFRLWLDSKHLAPMTVEIRIRSIKSFYKYNGIIYVSMERSNGKPVTLTVNDGIPTKEEIREILKVCDPLEKAIVLVGASSGLASNEIINLKIKDFKNGYCEDGITTLKLFRAKTNYKFVTFLTKEASEAVWDYLKYRDRSVKSKDQKRRNEQLYKQKVVDAEGYLFVSKAISEEYLTTHNE
jgi:integrase